MPVPPSSVLPVPARPADARDRWRSAMRRGIRGACPACGKGRLFTGYAQLNSTCSRCGTPFTPHRADDAPPYFTILILGHIIVPSMLLLEVLAHPPTWVQLALWLPLTLVLALVLLPRVKGAVIGLQWALDIRRDE